MVNNTITENNITPKNEEPTLLGKSEKSPPPRPNPPTVLTKRNSILKSSKPSVSRTKSTSNKLPPRPSAPRMNTKKVSEIPTLSPPKPGVDVSISPVDDYGTRKQVFKGEVSSSSPVSSTPADIADSDEDDYCSLAGDIYQVSADVEEDSIYTPLSGISASLSGEIDIADFSDLDDYDDVEYVNLEQLRQQQEIHVPQQEQAQTDCTDGSGDDKPADDANAETQCDAAVKLVSNNSLEEKKDPPNRPPSLPMKAKKGQLSQGDGGSNIGDRIRMFDEL